MVNQTGQKLLDRLLFFCCLFAFCSPHLGCTVETLKQSFANVPGFSTNVHGVPHQSEPDLEAVEAELTRENEL